MKPRRFTSGFYLLVLAFLMMSLVACTQSLEERETEPTQPVDVPAESGTATTGGERTPAPGETVVSVVTPSTPGTGTEPTVVTVGGTPTVATTPGSEAPVATAVPPAQPTPVPPSGGQGAAISHTVQQGETLSSIAQRYGTTWQAIAGANGLQNPDQIYVGQKLTIPTGSGGTSGGGATGCRLRHTVQQGEWVWQIARRYGTSPYDILAANGLTIQSANTIYPGAVLCIP